MTGLQIISELVAQRPRAVANQRPTGGNTSGGRQTAPQGVAQGDGPASPTQQDTTKDAEHTASPTSTTSGQPARQRRNPAKAKPAGNTDKFSQAQAAMAAASVQTADSPFAKMVRKLSGRQGQSATDDNTQPTDGTKVTLADTRPASPVIILAVQGEPQAAAPQPVATAMATQLAPNQAAGSDATETAVVVTGLTHTQPALPQDITIQQPQAIAPSPLQAAAQNVAGGEAAPQFLSPTATASPPEPPKTLAQAAATTIPTDAESTPKTTPTQPVIPPTVIAKTTVEAPPLQAPAEQAAPAEQKKYTPPVPINTQPVVGAEDTQVSTVAGAPHRQARPARATAAPTTLEQAVGQAAGQGERNIRIDVSGQADLPDAQEHAAAPSPVTAIEQPAAVEASGRPMAQTAGLAERTPAADQLVESIRMIASQASRRVVIRLDPPQLGSVRITLRGSSDGIRGIVEVDNPRTLAELQQAAPPLLQRLADAGIDVRRLDVVLNNDQGGHNAGDAGPDLRDGALAQQDSRQGGSGDGAGGDDAGDAPELNTADGQAAASYVSDDSINVWI